MPHPKKGEDREDPLVEVQDAGGVQRIAAAGGSAAGDGHPRRAELDLSLPLQLRAKDGGGAGASQHLDREDRGAGQPQRLVRQCLRVLPGPLARELNGGPLLGDEQQGILTRQDQLVGVGGRKKTQGKKYRRICLDKGGRDGDGAILGVQVDHGLRELHQQLRKSPPKCLSAGRRAS